MKNLWMVLLVLCACGVSPHDAAVELEHVSSHPEGWCGWEGGPPVEDVEKAFNHPDGYGITNTFGCFDSATTWPGGFCYAPEFLVIDWKLFKGGQDDAWYKKSTDEFGVVANLLNARGWTVTRDGDAVYDYSGHTGTTHPQGYLGSSVQSGWINHGNITGQGDYWTYNKCESWLYRTSIEANQFYQAASTTQRDKYLKNLWQHEYGHCIGLAHLTTSNLLMSVNYTFPGPLFDTNLNYTSGQLLMLEEFEPLN